MVVCGSVAVGVAVCVEEDSVDDGVEEDRGYILVSSPIPPIPDDIMCSLIATVCNWSIKRLTNMS